MNETDELFALWKSLTESKYPAASDAMLFNMRMQASFEWMTDSGSPLSNCFDQYVMLKTLKHPQEK